MLFKRLISLLILTPMPFATAVPHYHNAITIKDADPVHVPRAEAAQSGRVLERHHPVNLTARSVPDWILDPMERFLSKHRKCDFNENPDNLECGLKHRADVATCKALLSRMETHPGYVTNATQQHCIDSIELGDNNSHRVESCCISWNRPVEHITVEELYNIAKPILDSCGAAGLNVGGRSRWRAVNGTCTTFCLGARLDKCTI